MIIPPPRQAARQIQGQAVGPIVFLDAAGFLDVVQKQNDLIVITADPTALLRKYRYITSYKGITFFTQTKEKITLPSNAYVISVEHLHMPIIPMSARAQMFLLGLLITFALGIALFIILGALGFLKAA